jgi:hypothetical protein
MAFWAVKGVLTGPGSNGGTNVVSGLSGASGSETLKAVILWSSNQTAAGSANSDASFSMGYGTNQGGSIQQCYISTGQRDNNSAANAANAIGSDAILRAVSVAGGSFAFLNEVDLTAWANDGFTLTWTTTTSGAKIHYLALGGADITDARAFLWTVGTGSTTQNITTPGFQPDLLFLNQSNRTATGGGAGDTSFSLGLAKSATSRRVVAYGSDDGNGVQFESNAQRSKAFLGINPIATPAVSIEADLSTLGSWPVGGFQLTYASAPSVAYQALGLGLKGTFTSIVGSGVAPIAGTPPVTQDADLGVGVTPKAALTVFHPIPVNAGVDSTHADLGGFGLGATDGTNEGTAGLGTDDGQGFSATSPWHSETKTVSMYTTTTAAAALQSEADGLFSTTNFRLSWNDIDSVAREYSYVALGETAAAAATPKRLMLMGVG